MTIAHWLSLTHTHLFDPNVATHWEKKEGQQYSHTQKMASWCPCANSLVNMKRLHCGTQDRNHVFERTTDGRRTHGVWFRSWGNIQFHSRALVFVCCVEWDWFCVVFFPPSLSSFSFVNKLSSRISKWIFYSQISSSMFLCSSQMLMILFRFKQRNLRILDVECAYWMQTEAAMLSR